MDKGIIDRIDDLNLAVLAYNNESVIKEAYYTYFTISNRCELNSHLKRIGIFLKRYNISYDTFLDYVKAYGLLFLNISIETQAGKEWPFHTAEWQTDNVCHSEEDLHCRQCWLQRYH